MVRISHLNAFLRPIGIVAVALFAGLAAAETELEPMKVTVTILSGPSETVLPATLDHSPAGRDFAAMLPLELTLTDYNRIEKVADLGRKLDSTGMPGSYAPKTGDITQYAPWENLAIFTAPFRDSAGLVRLGALDGDISALAEPGEVTVRIERVD